MSNMKLEKNPTIIKNWRNNPKAIDKFRFMYHFLPKEQEKTRAGLLSHKAIIIYCLLIVLIAGIFRLIPMVFPGVLGYASNINIEDLLSYTNNRRKQSGLSELRLNRKLSIAAEKKASHMFDKNYWAHISPDGVEPWDFILDENYDYIYAGENLAKNFSDSDDVVEAWMESPSHRDNLLSPNYDEVGFAVVNGVLDGYETTLVVQLFGRPREKGQVASVFQEQDLLKELNQSKTEIAAAVPPNGGPDYSLSEKENISKEVPDSAPSPSSVSMTNTSSENEPLIDVAMETRGISIAFGGFISSLLALDVWYSKRKGILKFTGHTFAHITLLFLVIFFVWFVLRPGVIL